MPCTLTAVRARSVIALLATLLIAAAGAPAASAQEQRTISVAGEASLTARNDAARVGFAAIAVRPTRQAALNASSQRLRRVIAALRGIGVEEHDVRTGSVSVSRRRDRRGRPIAGFRAGQAVRAIVREARRAGVVVSAAVDAGATSVSGPSFFIADPRALLRRALGAAFQDARLKAEELARQSGLTLGRALAIRDRAFQDAGGLNVEGEGQDESGGGRGELRAAPTPTRPGNTRIDGSVDVVFEAR